MKHLVYVNRSKASKDTGLSYLGNVGQSAKIEKNLKYSEMTYVLYLAPADSSGYEVCPMRSKECTKLCLNTSGRVIADTRGNILAARIKKTQLFFENRRYFMQWLVDEIKAHKQKADREGMSFSIRLNGTSDLSPTQFHLDGKNILEIFPDCIFYDYTKVFNRFKLKEQYPNYDLTFSYSGHNMVECLDVLTSGIGRVAMVFQKQLPENHMGFPVVDGDSYDMRHIDPNAVIVGLKFKRVKGLSKVENNKFVINS